MCGQLHWNLQDFFWVLGNRFCREVWIAKKLRWQTFWHTFSNFFWGIFRKFLGVNLPSNGLTNFLRKKICQTASVTITNLLALIKGVGSCWCISGSYIEFIWSRKSEKFTSAFWGTSFVIRFWLINWTVCRPVFFGCNSIFVFRVEVKVEVKYKNAKLPLI